MEKRAKRSGDAEGSTPKTKGKRSRRITGATDYEKLEAERDALSMRLAASAKVISDTRAALIGSSKNIGKTRILDLLKAPTENDLAGLAPDEDE